MEETKRLAIVLREFDNTNIKGEPHELGRTDDGHIGLCDKDGNFVSMTKKLLDDLNAYERGYNPIEELHSRIIIQYKDSDDKIKSYITLDSLVPAFKQYHYYTIRSVYKDDKDNDVLKFNYINRTEKDQNVDKKNFIYYNELVDYKLQDKSNNTISEAKRFSHCFLKEELDENTLYIVDIYDENHMLVISKLYRVIVSSLKILDKTYNDIDIMYLPTELVICDKNDKELDLIPPINNNDKNNFLFYERYYNGIEKKNPIDLNNIVKEIGFTKYTPFKYTEKNNKYSLKKNIKHK